MAWVAGNKDPYSADTSQQHESHTSPAGSVVINPSQITPAGVQPSTLGLKAWTFDPILNNTGITQFNVSASAYFVYVPTPGGLTVSNVYLDDITAGTGVTDLQVALYDLSGNRLALVTGQQALVTGNVIMQIPLSAVVTGSGCYVGVTTVSTSAPAFGGNGVNSNNTSAINLGIKRSFQVTSGGLAASVNVTSAPLQGIMTWAALS